MIFCSKCGNKCSENEEFCGECGAKINGGSLEVQQAEPETQVFQQHQNENNNKKITKTQKIIAIIGVVIFAALIVIYSVGASLTSKDKVVTRFNQAIASKDSSQMAKYIVSSDSKQKVDSKIITGILRYIDKNPSYKNEIKTSIEKQTIKPDPNAKFDFHKNGDLFTLKKQGKTWIFFDKYVFELKPVYIRVRTDYKDTQIFLEDKLIATADKDKYEKEVGPFNPGIYKIKALFKGKHVDLEKNKDIDLMIVKSLISTSKNINSVNLSMDAYQVSVSSDYEDAKLFVNGKDTGLLVKDAKDFGPVTKDGSIKMYLQKEFPWGVMKGEEVKIVGDKSMKLKLSGLNEELQTSMMEKINVFRKACLDAQTARDTSKITNVSVNRKKQLDQLLKLEIDAKLLYAANVIKISYDLDSMKVYQKDNKFYAEINTKESLNFAEYKEGEPVPKGKMIEAISKEILVYDEASKNWLLDQNALSILFDTQNVKEFNFQ